MTVVGDNNKTGKRKTLSLKINTGVSATRPVSGNKTIEVEIKRKRHG